MVSHISQMGGIEDAGTRVPVSCAVQDCVSVGCSCNADGALPSTWGVQLQAAGICVGQIPGGILPQQYVDGG